MKKIHIVILVGIAVCIMILLSFMADLSTYETLASARQKAGKTVTVIAKLDKSAGLLGQGVVRFDLRIPGKMVVRLPREPGEPILPETPSEG